MNESDKPSRDAAQTRRRLLEAARQSVRTGGLAGATSRQITTLAGVNLGAITYHFGSKEALIAEALFGELEQRVQPALDALGGDGPAGELMLRAVQQLLTEFERSRDDAPVALEALLMAIRDPAYQRRVDQLHAAIREPLVSLLVELIGDGVIPTWVEPGAMTSLIMAVANGIILQTLLEPHGPDHVAMATQFASLLLAAAPQS